MEVVVEFGVPLRELGGYVVWLAFAGVVFGWSAGVLGCVDLRDL